MCFPDYLVSHEYVGHSGVAHAKQPFGALAGQGLTERLKSKNVEKEHEMKR